MQTLFSRLLVNDVHEAVFRNIVSIQISQDLFDDLSADPHEWVLAQEVEADVKPPSFSSGTPIIHRPFEDAHWLNAIDWPFQHWQASRYSDGRFGVWYGADSVETTVYETAYHWYTGFLMDAGFQHHSVQIERKVYQIRCDAMLLDLRACCGDFPAILHPSDYGFTQSLGARLHKEGHPGLLTPSVRYPSGISYVIFNPEVLSDPRHHCQLSYRLEGDQISVVKQADQAPMVIECAEWSLQGEV